MTSGDLRLLADIGGTNARFCLQAADGQLELIEVLPCADFATLGDAITSYLGYAAARGFAIGGLRRAGLAIANPVEGDLVSMTNHHWSFSIAQLRSQLDFSTLLVVNDFAALAMSLPTLDAGQRQRIGDGEEVSGRPMGLVGPGTGLGVGAVVPAAGRWFPLPGEGGHVSFAPVNRDEMKILDLLWNEFGHISAERLLSGPGLELIQRALGGERLGAADITARALDGSCADCRKTVETFCAMLGSVAGNVALTLGATGGMYIGGGIVPRLGALFEGSAFRRRFEDKGRLGAYLARIPTYVITEPYAALRGVAAMLEDQLAATSS